MRSFRFIFFIAFVIGIFLGSYVCVPPYKHLPQELDKNENPQIEGLQIEYNEFVVELKESLTETLMIKLMQLFIVFRIEVVSEKHNTYLMVVEGDGAEILVRLKKLPEVKRVELNKIYKE